MQFKTKTSILTNSLTCLKNRKGGHGDGPIATVAKNLIYGFLNTWVFFFLLFKYNLAMFVSIFAIFGSCYEKLALDGPSASRFSLKSQRTQQRTQH